MASVSRLCAASGHWRGAAHAATTDTAAGHARVSSARRAIAVGERCARKPCSRSSTAARPANASNSHTVPGSLPSWSMAKVSAPKATNSPCGMKITRVMANTSTVASASSAYTAPLVAPSSARMLAIEKSMEDFVAVRGPFALRYRRARTDERGASIPQPERRAENAAERLLDLPVGVDDLQHHRRLV